MAESSEEGSIDTDLEIEVKDYEKLSLEELVDELATLDEAIRELNDRKIKLLFEILEIKFRASDLKKILDTNLLRCDYCNQ